MPSKSVFLPVLGVLALAASPATAQFNIEVRLSGSVTSTIQRAFDDAAARWSQVIVGDIPDVTFSSTRTFNCGGRQTFFAGERLDDLVIFASINSIDGVGGTLGAAGPCASDSQGFTRLGTMQFDSADVNNLISQGTFDDVILHEMGHVLGLGTKWTQFNRNFRYTGAGGNAGHQQIGGVGRPFIEDEFGPGTRGGHWDEAEYQSELMTGFLSGSLELSVMTVGALQDLGFTVNANAADSFIKPRTAARGTEEGLNLEGDVLVQDVTYTIDLDGAVTQEISNKVGAAGSSGSGSDTTTMVAAVVGVASGMAVLAVGAMIGNLRRKAGAGSAGVVHLDEDTLAAAK